VLLRESPNRLPFPKNARAVPQVVTIASPSPSIRSFVYRAFSRAAVFISSKLCMVTIFGARFIPEFYVNREYRGMLGAEKGANWALQEKLT
jgi:hypothetical protein